MNKNRLTTSVQAVPNSVHQRMYSSLPLGKKSSTSAKALGKKMHKDINIRSNSTMESLNPILVCKRLTTDFTDNTDKKDLPVFFHLCYPCNPWLSLHFSPFICRRPSRRRGRPRARSKCPPPPTPG